jgi:uncharacterized protein (TIGR02145 family)
MYLVITEQVEVDGELFYEGVSWKDYHKVPETTKTIKYGRLYNWYAAIDDRGIAPEGYHIPTIAEWGNLVDYLGGTYVAGAKVKELGDEHWLWQDPNTTNESGFTALPGGQYDTVSGSYNMRGNASWWSTSRYSTNLALFSGVQLDADVFGHNQTSYLDIGFSIRCIKDNEINEGSVTDIDGNIYNTIKIGNQVWLQQNLATKHYRNGDLISSNFAGIEGAVIAYNNDENNVYNFIQNDIKGFIITYNNIDYIIPDDKAIETPRFTREQNIPFGEYQYRTHSDKTTEYFEPVEKYFGIDMKENYSAQFRDGINPHKDINGSIFKEDSD